MNLPYQFATPEDLHEPRLREFPIGASARFNRLASKINAKAITPSTDRDKTDEFHPRRAYREGLVAAETQDAPQEASREKRPVEEHALTSCFL
jgi:hypothetical protein